ncbi:MAG: hypothetical protein ABIJ95_02040, partial [Pseudomonadota bacterium]
ARLRAVENRRWMIRASVSGISAILSPTGEVQAQTPLFQPARIQGRVQMLDAQSPYTRLGDWPLFLSVALLALARRVRGRGKETANYAG